MTTDLIRKTAQLAQLSFEEDELAALVPRIESFLRFADKMQEVQDSGKPPLHIVYNPLLRLLLHSLSLWAFLILSHGMSCCLRRGWGGGGPAVGAGGGA